MCTYSENNFFDFLKKISTIFNISKTGARLYIYDVFIIVVSPLSMFISLVIFCEWEIY
jgi:hypothetical protein